MPKRKPIIIRGARQVGKSTLVILLAEKLRLDLCTVNFEKNPNIAQYFTSNDPLAIVQLLRSHFKQEIVVGKTLLFLDEIQATPQVISSLRYFYEELPDLHIIAAGSLLEFALQDINYSIPVGRIEYMYMGPLSFEEFIEAIDEQHAVQFLQNYTLTMDLPQALHEKFMNLLALYYIVGGMPESVASYAEYRNLATVERIKFSILETFQDDFAKYAKREALTMLQKTFDKIPLQIGKKFQYVQVDNTVRSDYIAKAITQLCLAKVAEKVFHTSANGIPLGAEKKDRNYKVIFLDIGLVNTILGVSITSLLPVESLLLINKGALAEQMIGQHLLYQRPLYETPKLFFWSREKKGSSAELDYIISIGKNIIPIEIKAGKFGTLKSLHTFLHEKDLRLALRFNANLPVIQNENIIMSASDTINFKLVSLPLYMVGQAYRLVGSQIVEKELMLE